MKIEKVEMLYECELCIGTAQYKIFQNRIICLCDSCFQELKSLELPKEPVFEWQYIWVMTNGSYGLTTRYFKDDEEFISEYKTNYFEKYERSKRERGTNEI